MTGFEVTTEIDITRDVCPMTFVRTRLALDRLRAGDLLRVHLCGEEPWRNVVHNAIALGHTVIADDVQDDGSRLVIIRKGLPDDEKQAS